MRPQVEDIGEVVGVVPGDAVARFGRAHGFEQLTSGSPTRHRVRRIAQTAGLCHADRPVGFARILDAELVQNAVKPALEIAALPLERRLRPAARQAG